MNRPPRIAVTLGDPAGIGPEIALRAVHDLSLRAVARLVLVGPPAALARASRAVDLPADFPSPSEGGEGPWLHAIEGGPLPPLGRSSAEGGRLAGKAVEEAVRLVRSGVCEALTTGPLDKASLRLAGYPYVGHTPMLVHLDGAQDAFMVFRTAGWSVVLVTDHVPLRSVPDLLTADRIVRAVALASDVLGGGGRRPLRVAVAALNPHAGEGGLMGTEDRQILAPAARRLAEIGFEAAGPLPADTVYRRAARGEFDLVASPYHDQGLVAVKTLGLGSTVHITAGLSFVRTSVDHGTAYDIAGRGSADPAPLAAAVREAARLAGG